MPAVRALKKMIRAVLIDLNGTLHVEDSPIPGTIEALQRLRNYNIRMKFVTNTTTESKRLLHENLIKMGFNIKVDEIITSLTFCNKVLKSENLNPLMLVAKEALEDFEVKTIPEKKIDAVVIGLAPKEFTYDRLNEAFRHLMEGAKILAIHEGRYQKGISGLNLGPGCFTRGLQYATNCQIEVVGKPVSHFFKSAVEEGIPLDQVVMIGDDVISDVKGAMDAGMQGWLVKTGKYREKEFERLKIVPTKIFPSFVEAVDEIISSMEDKNTA